MRIVRGDQLKIILILTGVNVLIMAVLTYLSPTFMTYGNITAVMTRMSELGMLAIAETVVLISGGFDISIGAVMALSGAVLGTLHIMGLPFSLSIVIALAAGVAVGFLNAVLVVNLRLTPFIVTLATMSIVRSVVYALLKGNVLTELPEAFLELYYVYVFKLPLLFVILVAIAVIMILVLKKTILGRRIYAIGGNERTAFISGVYVKRIRYLVYCLSGFICALAGLLFTVRIRAVIPDAGLNAPLEVITAVLIGGTTIYGGKGSILGSLLGILAMYLLLNGFSLLGLNPFWEVIILGVILIVVIGQEGIVTSFKAPFLKRRA
jgi:ribose transport system permease protein